MTINPDYDLKPLVLAVLIRAAREANEGSEEARRWMEEESIVWLDAVGVGIHPEKIKRWVSMGYKMSRHRMMQAQAC